MGFEASGGGRNKERRVRVVCWLRLGRPFCFRGLVVRERGREGGRRARGAKMRLSRATKNPARLDSAVERGRVGMERVTRVYPTYTRSMPSPTGWGIPYLYPSQLGRINKSPRSSRDRRSGHDRSRPTPLHPTNQTNKQRTRSQPTGAGSSLWIDPHISLVHTLTQRETPDARPVVKFLRVFWRSPDQDSRLAA